MMAAGILAGALTAHCGAPRTSGGSPAVAENTGALDAGDVVAAGGDAGTPDAGEPFSVGADAGSEDGGALALEARVRPGPGASTADCQGILPAAAGDGQRYETAYAPYNAGYCGLPQGNDDGIVALERSDSDRPAWDLISPTGHKTGSFKAWWGNAFATSGGFIGETQATGRITGGVVRYSETGQEERLTAVKGFGAPAPDPSGGLLLAGRYQSGQQTMSLAPISAWMFNPDASLRWGPTVIARDGSVAGAAVDTLGRSIVLVGGSPQSGPGPVSAQWFAEDGTPMTGMFEVLRDFSPGYSTFLEGSPLIGGGIALRRLDVAPDGNPSGTSRWIVAIGSGAARADAPPEWLASRPNTRLQLTREGRAYALLPDGAHVTPCSQSIEVLAPSGASCGALELPVDDAACVTRDLRLGLDGTVLQMLPFSREHDLHSWGPRSCTLRFWPAALR
jgi:hypothetical protein